MQPIYIIAPPNPGKIIGRVALLANIHSELQSGQPVALVHGIGGIGKTTAAAAYAHHPEYSIDYEAICWLEVVQDLPRAFASAVALQRFLGVEAQVKQILLTPQPDPEIPREVYALMDMVDALLHCPQRLLILLDNANEEQELRRYILKLKDAPHVRILITSRADCDDLNPIAVEALPPDEAATLFRQHYGDERKPGEPESPEVYDLIASFDHHTLLVEMLGKIGREAGYALPELLRHVRELTLREEKWQIQVGTGQSGRTHRMNKQTLKTYLAHLFREIKTLSEDDTGLLRRICVLPNRSYSTEQLAQLLAREGDAVFALRKQLAALDQRGIPIRDAEQRGGWRLHPLFREFCLDQLGPFTAENLKPLVDVVGKMIVIGNETQNWQQQIDNRFFGEELLQHLEADEVGWQSYLQNQLSLCYTALGRYVEARDLLEAALASALINFGAEHPNVAVSQSNLANVYSNLGQYERARDLLEAALASDLKNFGAEHPKVAVSQSNLANVYRNLGQYEKARDLLEVALASALKNFGAEHPTVAVRQSNLANVYSDLGQYERARDLLEAALASDLKNFGAEHPNVAVRQSNLANVYSNLGQYEKARDLLEAALASALKNFGAEHPKVAVRQSNLGNVYSNLGQYERARDLLEVALASALKNFGAEHPKVAVDRNNLAHVYHAEGNYQAAIEQFQEALRIVEKTLGRDHPYYKQGSESLEAAKQAAEAEDQKH